MVPLREASRGHPRAATCGFVARKGTLAESHITYLAPHNARPHHNLRHGKWLHPLEVFFNTTNRLVVMAFKLCQEGNKEPLFNNRMQMRHSFAKAVGGSSVVPYSHLDFVVHHRHRDASPKAIWIDHPFGQAHK
jgi:hypothetical protein